MMTTNPHQADGSSGASRPSNDLHVYGVITIALEVCLLLENLMPVFVVIFWRRPCERTVSDKLIASLSAAYILSALVPTPLGLASYFHGSWYGGPATCECFQVTSTWCSLSALAVVTYLSVDLHLTACSPHTTEDARDPHSNSTCITSSNIKSNAQRQSPAQRHPGQHAPATGKNSCLRSCTSGPSGRDISNLLLFAVFTVTLVIASLPVVGYGPEVMPHNYTCDSWLIDTPVSPKRRTYFVAFLSFAYLNLFTTCLGVAGAMLVLRSLHKKCSRWEGEPRYTEESRAQCCNGHRLESGGSGVESVEAAESVSSRSCKMAGLILANQAMWIPALAIATVQKVGYPLSDATMMYAILSTSLPGLLNPLLLALLFRDYRLGYRYVLLRLCCRCCGGHGDDSNSMKNLRSRSSDSLHRLSDGELSIHGSTLHIDDATSKGCPVYAYPQKTDLDSTEIDDQDRGSSYVVVELPNERTPLQGPATASSRPIIASLYDEYGELSGMPKTELLSPCGSEECLINPELFRAQTESVV